MSVHHFDDCMHVIRHETPSQHAITPAIEMQERSFDERGNFRPVQPASTEAEVQFALYAMNITFTMAHRLRDRLRQTIAQPKRHKLDDFRRVEVR